jgi:uncharacterized protein (TIGR03437 family)
MTRNNRIRLGKAFSVLVIIPVWLYAFSGGPPPAKTGAPGESNCTECHFGTPITNAEGISLQVPGNNFSYTPGVAQEWVLQASRPGAAIFGFQATVRTATNSTAGTLTAVDASTRVLSEDNKDFVEHTLPSPAGTFRFRWTPPSSDLGPLTVYVAVNAANGNGDPSGDTILLRTFALTPAAATPTKPAIGAGGIVNAASNRPGISAGSWVSIYGTDLSGSTRGWNPATEIIEGRFPTQLDGVQVTINGKPAAISFISPGQVNVQAPDDTAEGPVSVEVIRDGARSDPQIAQLRKEAPGFFVFSQGGGRFAAAVHAALDQGRPVYVGPVGLFGDAALSRPAKPGDIILIFATGFGPTDPPVPSGRLFEGAARLIDTVTIRLGTLTLPAANVEFAGLSGAGLNQFNVRIPDNVAEGEVSLSATINGIQTQDGVVLLMGSPVASDIAVPEPEPEPEPEPGYGY